MAWIRRDLLWRLTSMNYFAEYSRLDADNSEAVAKAEIRQRFGKMALSGSLSFELL